MAESVARHGNRSLAAIVSGDVAGYSRLIAADEDATIRALGEARERIAALVAQHQGRLVDFTGDNFLAEFPAARDAIECGLAIQRGLEEQNAEIPEALRLRFRIGAHLGDVRHEGGRVYGDGVNIAARLQPLAEPGGLCLSAAMAEQVRGKLPLALADLGEQRLKNIAEPVRAFRVRAAPSGHEPPAAAEPAPPRSALRRPRVRRWLTIVAAALAFGAAPVWWFWKSPTQQPASPPMRYGVAVLPIATLDGDAESRILADGLTEQITHALSQNGYPVVARTTAALYRERAADVRVLGDELGVSHVLEGSVQRDRGQVRVTMQLIDTESGLHAWSEVIEQPEGDLFAIQDEVTDRIAFKVYATLSPELVAMRRYPELAEISRLFAEHRVLQASNRWAEIPTVLRQLLSAMPDEERFKRPRGDVHASLSQALEQSYHFDLRSFAEVGQTFLEHAESGVELAPDSAWAQHVYANALIRHRQWDAAERAVKRVCELAPRDGGVCGSVTVHLCAALGCLEQQVAAAQLWVEETPAEPMTWWLLGFALRDNHRLEEAEAAMMRAREIEELYGIDLPDIQWRLGKRDAAVESLRRFAAAGATWLTRDIDLARASGPEAVWRTIADRFARGGEDIQGAPGGNQFVAALYYADLGDDEAALSALERSVNEHESGMGPGWTHSAFDGLRDTPRFRALIEKMGLTAYHAKYLKRAPIAAETAAP